MGEVAGDKKKCKETVGKNFFNQAELKIENLGCNKKGNKGASEWGWEESTSIHEWDNLEKLKFAQEKGICTLWME